MKWKPDKGSSGYTFLGVGRRKVLEVHREVLILKKFRMSRHIQKGAWCKLCYSTPAVAEMTASTSAPKSFPSVPAPLKGLEGCK